ncbi:MAG: cytochrome c oxidase subunit II [Planctomycetaceae bacterium]|nr:cytochrome c oxidase subunit II [Planctomycetaceae bacterium]
MGRFWSILFLLVPILGVAVFVCAIMTDSLYGYWFPEDISDHGYIIDNLFDTIMYLTGLIFVVTGVMLFWFMWKYDATKNAEPVVYTHGSHTLEVVWSILPAATLLFIAIYQMNAWADAKIIRPTEIAANGEEVVKPPIVQVTGRQFEWRMRYAGKDRIIGTPDDVFTVNELHLPVGEEAVITIKSDDVLHSFFLPNARVKQDLVPGMKQFVWFRPLKTGEFDIVCAELCGWGHYKMKGRLTVQSRSEFDAWLVEAEAAQTVAAFTPSDEDE